MPRSSPSGATSWQRSASPGETVLELNTLGDSESRQAWRAALIGYFARHAGPAVGRKPGRLERNPLRILDSKSPADQALLAEAPTIGAYLTPEAQAFWDGLRSALDGFGVRSGRTRASCAASTTTATPRSSS